MSVFVSVSVIASNRGRNGEPQAAFLEGGRASLRAVAAAWDHQRPNKPTPPLLNNEEEDGEKEDDAVEKIENVNPQSPNKRIPLLFNDAQKRFLLKIRKDWGCVGLL